MTNAALHVLKRAVTLQQKPVPSGSLAAFRVLFGLMMFVAGVRFWANGWIETQYLEPDFHFTYYGFDWVSPLPAPFIYWVYALMLITALGIAAGAWYRLCSVCYFLLFTYFELIDKSFYLNHYYFVSLVALLMVFIPANRVFSVDLWLGKVRAGPVPLGYVNLLRFQLCVVYFFAGIAKINPDWLLRGEPMATWLHAHATWPLIGGWLQTQTAALTMSWAGMLFDISIPFWVNCRATRLPAYLAIVTFHTLTAVFFPFIGVFPFVMMVSGIIFFPAHRFRLPGMAAASQAAPMPRLRKPLIALAGLFMAWQLFWPVRQWLYSGSLFWHEQGFRFSWRVMLMEKNGHTEFTVVDPDTGRKWDIANGDYLTAPQEKQMVSQPDMILQFAHYLESLYLKQGIADPEVYAYCWISLNGRPVKKLIDEKKDLSAEKRGFGNKDWITSTSDYGTSGPDPDF